MSNLQELEEWASEEVINPLVPWAAKLVISNNEEKDEAINALKHVKTEIKGVKESFDEQVKTAHAAHKAAVAHRDSFLAPLKEIEKQVKLAVLKFDEEQERKAREEEARLRKEAEAKAEEERKKLLAQAEAEKDPLEKEIKKIEAETKETLPEISVTVEKTKGTRVTWEAHVIDTDLLPKRYMIPDMQYLNKEAKNPAVRERGIPGVEFKEKKTLSMR